MAKIKRLELDDIEIEAWNLLHDYSEKVEKVLAPPVPVVEIFDCFLNFTMRFQDLRQKYGNDKILAEIYILSKKVIVDQSLDPEVHPDKEGRYNFTLAHEIGHWVLHRHDVIAVADIPDMFGTVPPPAICRDGSKDPCEWQADRFAAALLMPKDFIETIWQKHFPEGTLNVFQEMQEKRKKFHIPDSDPSPICDAVRQLAPEFHVSMQALQKRLRDLRYLDFNMPQDTLF